MVTYYYSLIIIHLYSHYMVTYYYSLIFTLHGHLLLFTYIHLICMATYYYSLIIIHLYSHYMVTYYYSLIFTLHGHLYSPYMHGHLLLFTYYYSLIFTLYGHLLLFTYIHITWSLIFTLYAWSLIIIHLLLFTYIHIIWSLMRIYLDSYRTMWNAVRLEVHLMVHYWDRRGSPLLRFIPWFITGTGEVHLCWTRGSVPFVFRCDIEDQYQTNRCNQPRREWWGRGTSLVAWLSYWVSPENLRTTAFS